MREVRTILRHFLAALSYRTQKALHEAPEGFGTFRAGQGSRTPAELLNHMNALIAHARTFLLGGETTSESVSDLSSESSRFYALLYSLSSDLQSDLPLRGVTHEQLLHGPLSDAMTHAGQLALLRRLAGAPIEAENFIEASIGVDHLRTGGPDSL